MVVPSSYMSLSPCLHLCAALMQNVKQPSWMDQKKQIPVTEILVVGCILAHRCVVSVLVTVPPLFKEYKVRGCVCIWERGEHKLVFFF